jgi:hypothetical protein
LNGKKQLVVDGVAFLIVKAKKELPYFRFTCYGEKRAVPINRDGLKIRRMEFRGLFDRKFLNELNQGRRTPLVK